MIAPRIARLLAVMLAAMAGGAAVCSAATVDECQGLKKHGKNDAAEACYQTLSQDRSAYLRAEGDWGLGNYDRANTGFRQAVAENDANATYRVRWGMLLHERFNNTDADNLFKEAVDRDPKNARGYLGLALVSADGFDNDAIKDVLMAIQLDPKLVEAHELFARLALEDSDAKQAETEADAALKISPEALDAMAVHAAVELIADRSPDPWFEKIREVNPTYGGGYEFVGDAMGLNYRYEDGVVYYRKAIEVDPKLWSARSKLGVNLMRLGQEDEPRKLLEECYQNGYRNEETVNSLRLLDSYKNFETFKSADGTMILRFNKKEADALRPYFEEVLSDAMTAYDKKYKMKLPGPVQVEVYPNHEDFAVRTMGMPGLEGALGVTFGEVVAMDSPSSRKPGDFHWAETLRHEMSHVYILTATNHRVPRWFTEGLAVHEESQASPEWGDRISPEVILALHDKKLLPVVDLDQGFVRPAYPDQVLVSYFEAGKICDYIQERWGADKLLDFVHSYAQKKTTTQAVQENLGMTTEAFDKEFQASVYASVADIVANFDSWRSKLKALATASESQKYDEVIKNGPEVIRMYPDYVYDANAYEFMAQADLAIQDKKAAQAILTQYEKAGGRDLDSLKKLAQLEEEAGDPKEAAATYQRMNFIDPLYEADYHRHLGELWMAQQNYPGAVREFTVVVAMQPLDKASAEYNLATAYVAAGQKDKAEDSVLASLEAAPGYRPAQKLLLQLQDSQKGK
jgi:tetratricopeptide (TPR) repeat protein